MKRLEDMTEPELKELMRTAAECIEYAFHYVGVEGPKFLLVVFNDPKIAQYIGNCERADMIASMRETAHRLENRHDVPR